MLARITEQPMAINLFSRLRLLDRPYLNISPLIQYRSRVYRNLTYV